MPDGFVAELTYGPSVNWYRNIRAGGGRILHRGEWFRITAIEPYPTDDGLRAFGPPASWVFRILRRRDFRLIRVVAQP